MKIFTLAIFLISTMSFAASETKTCTSADGKISLEIKYSYNSAGKFSGSTKVNGVKLVSTSAKAFPTLEGWTTGDMDNYQTYQLTILDTNEGSEAILISQDHVDRVGLFNTVDRLNCK